MSKRLEELGAEVARIQDETLADDDGRRMAVRRRLSSGEAEVEQRGFRWVPVLSWAGAVSAIGLVIVLAWPKAPEPIAYRVDDGAESSTTERTIAAPSDRATSIAFTDGSSILLAPSAVARVRQLRTDGATVALDRGEATVSVRHRKQTDWSVEAGPFFVRVTGTRFRVGWQPEEQRFALEVLEGEVRLRGPDAAERVLRQGDALDGTLAPALAAEPSEPKVIPEPESAPVEEPAVERATNRDAEREPAAPQRPTTPPERARSYPEDSSRPPPSSSRGSYRPPPALELDLPPKDSDRAEPEGAKPESEANPEGAEQEVPEPPAEPTSAEAPDSAPSGWKEMLDQGDYEALLTELSPGEVEQVLWRAAPSQLIDLGTTARHLSDARAGYIYSVARSRFPGTNAAADAAFVLGRMQFHAGTYRTSATWFETYLRERPDGRFAREAAGRLIEAYDQSGDADRAHDAAEEYLRRYPNGPHAGLARSVLQ